MDFQRTRVHPGPIDRDVLVLGPVEHRCDKVWHDPLFANVPLKCVKFFGSLNERLRVDRPERVTQILQEYGFYGVEKISKLQIDWALITALVERWRPETHAFHLPFGEVGITLQDVEILLGLPVDGTPVIGSPERSKNYWVQLCEDTMGFGPNLADVSKTQIKMNAIRPIELNGFSGEVDFMHHARALMLKIMGGALFASTTGNKVNLCLLELLMGTAQDVRSRAIGTAVLACLYRNMCHAALVDTAQIGGPLVLLQVWAWERIPMCRPQGVLPIEVVAGAPYGVRWVCNHRFTLSSAHSIRPYRDQLDRLQEREYIWMPYPSTLKLHPHCYAGMDIWYARVPLIYIYTVEGYYPDRFCRQFYGLQDIPQAVEHDHALHALRTTTGRLTSGQEHFIAEWDARHESVVQFDLNQVGFTQAYRDWYYRRGRRFIGNSQHRDDVFPGYISISPDVQCLLFGMLDIARRTDVDHLDQGADVITFAHDIHERAVQCITDAGYTQMLAHPRQPHDDESDL